MNVFVATGYVGKDPETRYAKTGTAITTFPLPVTQGWGDNEKTTWVKCTLFGRKGTRDEHGLVKHIAKGKLVTIHGEIVLEEWEGKDGHTNKMLCCILNDVVVTFNDQPAQPRHQETMNTAHSTAEPVVTVIPDDDIPF